jgi:hypothetical protein
MIKNKLAGTTEQNIKQEFKNLSVIGFAKRQDYSKLFKTYITHGTFEDKNIPREDVSGRAITTLKEDKRYVKTLNDFDSKLPKIN